MENDNDYVEPSLEIYPNFKEIKESISTSPIGAWQEAKSLKDVLGVKHSFVVAEPGYGKSRLLEELYKLGKNKGCNVYSCSLKDIDTSNSIRKSLNVNSENSIVLLDALDEVRHNDFRQTVERIKELVRDCPDTQVIVSSRWQFFDKYQQLFSQDPFSYVRILPLNDKHVEQFLIKKGLSTQEAHQVFNNVQTPSRNNILQTPRYLEYLIKYVNDVGIDSLKDVTRSTLLEHFITQALKNEEDKDEGERTDTEDLIKRVWAKLALVMEMYQTNTLTKDELMTFFDDLDSDLKNTLLHHMSLETIYKRTLLKENIDSVEFENAEFQEYLAAKELTRLQDPIHAVFKVAVEPTTREVYPSWFNTLSYLVDLDISFLKPLLDLGSSQPDSLVHDETYHNFLTKVDVNRLSPEERSAIFDQVFMYYQTLLNWLGSSVADNLTAYFDMSQMQLLKGFAEKSSFDTDTQRYVQLGNAAYLIGYLVKNKRIGDSDKAYWQQKLISYANDANTNGVLQRHALYSLSQFDDKSIIDDTKSAIQGSDELIRDAYIQMCINIDPNYSASVDAFILATCNKSIYARYGLRELSKTSSLKKFLRSLVNYKQFLSSFIDHHSIFGEQDNQIIEHLASAWTAPMQLLAKQVILASLDTEIFYQAEKGDFIANLVSLIQDKDPGYIWELVDQVGNDDSPLKHFYKATGILCNAIRLEDVEEFINKIGSVESDRTIAFVTLQRARHLGRSDSEQIYEAGRSHLTDLYNQAEQSSSAQPPENQQLYNEFSGLLEAENLESINYFINSREKLGSLISDADKIKLSGLVSQILNQFDPTSVELRITNQTDGSKQYTTVNWIHFYGACIKAASMLHMDVSNLRLKIVAYIPFAYEDQQDSIFSLLGGDLSQEEIDLLLSIYQDETHDLWRNIPSSLINSAKKFRIIDASPVLKKFVETSEIDNSSRKEALAALEELTPDQSYLQSIFDTDDKLLTTKANDLLITNHKDRDAIKWRLDEIKARKFPFHEPIGMGIHTVGPNEDELHSMEFAKPLMNLKDPDLQEDLLSLLGFSFELLSQGDEFTSYAHYIWKIVGAYFENLRELRGYEPIKNLENYVSTNATTDGANWFNGTLAQLKRSYLDYLGKPSNIAECVHNYNQLKQENFLKIKTAFDLKEFVREVLDTDLREWAIGEGRKLLRDQKETYVQKMLAIEIDNILLRKDLRINRFSLVREAQLLDDTRTDFLISYGFIGPLVLEVKLSKHGDLKGTSASMQTKESYIKLKGYMSGYRANYGFFLVMDNRVRTKRSMKWDTHLGRVKDAYQSIDNVLVVGISENV